MLKIMLVFTLALTCVGIFHVADNLASNKLSGHHAYPDDSPCLKKAENDNAKKVVKACESKWEANKADCNAFLRATAKELNINDFKDGQNADQIIDFLEGKPAGWTKLTNGSHQDAQKMAKDGNFVVAGLKSSDLGDTNGHVVVISCGDMVHSAMDNLDYPRGYWGKLNSVGKECEGMNYAFPAPPRKKDLRYYWRKLP